MIRKLSTLKPRIPVANVNRVATLETKAGATLRIRGRKWMRTRDRVALAHEYRCASCGRLWNERVDQIDHRVPLEQGGSNDDSNLQPLCDDCHKVKTAAEAKGRSSAAVV